MKIENIVFSISGSFFLLVGLAAAYFGHRNVKLAEQSIGWGSVMGKIITSDVVATQFDNAENPVHQAVVNYTYSVYGKEYKGSRISFGDGDISNLNEMEATATAKRYPAGCAVRVYYNPDNANESILAYDRSDKINVLLRIGIICCVIGAGMLYWFGLKHIIS